MSISIDKNYLLRILQDLVRINSINPSLVPEAPGEKEIAEYIANLFRELNLEIYSYETRRGRVSTVGVLRGTGGGKSLMLNAHIDTVGIEGMEAPFSAAVKDGKLYGRGAYDMKGSAAACIAAAKALADGGVQLSGNLVIAMVADEEFESIGTQEVIKHHKTDAAIVTEPTQLQICLAHKGFIWLEVETTGRAAHGSRFEEGIDANIRMGRFLAELDMLEQALRSQPGHPLVGPPSLHAATIHGGSGLSTYADKCTLMIERRTVPGETVELVLGQIQSIIDKLTAVDPTFSATVHLTCVRDAFEVSEMASIVQAIGNAAESVLGYQPKRFGDTPWMDSAFLSAAGIETVVMGPSGTGAHAAVEWVDIQSVEQCARILADTAIEYCR